MDLIKDINFKRFCFKISKKLAFPFLISLILTSVFVSRSFANQWDGGGADNNWSTTGNWDGPDDVPDAGESAGFNGSTLSNKDCTIDVDTAALTNLEFRNYTGTVSAGSKTINLTGRFYWENTNTGTFDPGTSTFLWTGSTNTQVNVGTTSGDDFYNITLQRDATANRVSIVTGSINIQNNLTITTGTFLTGSASAHFDFTLGKDLTIDTNGSFTSQGDTVTFNGTTQTYTNNQSSTSGIGNIVVSNGSTLSLAGTGSPFKFTNVTINSGGTLSAGAGNERIRTSGTWTNNNATKGNGFTEGTGEVQFTDATTIASNEIFYDLTARYSSGGTLTINGDVTVSNDFKVDNASGAATISSGKTLEVDGLVDNSAGGTITVTGTLQADGTITNAGTITETGTIKHAATSVKITNSAGTELTSVSAGDNLYAYLIDEDENLDGASADTSTGVTITSTTGDSEAFSGTYILTETGNATETFINATAIATALTDGNVTANDGTLEILPGETLTMSYTDAEDSTDNAASDTVTTSTSTSSTIFINSAGTSITTYTLGSDTTGKAYIQVTDSDENTNSSSKQTVTATVTSATTTDSVTVTLTETGNNTGIFNNTATGLTYDADDALNTSNTTLETRNNDTITVSYTDNDDATDTGSDTATISASTGIVTTTLSVTPTTVSIGDQILFTATVQNKTSEAITFSAIANLSPGIDFVPGSAKVDSATITDPTTRDPLTITISNLASNTTKTITFLALVGSGAPVGKSEVSFYAQVNPVVSNTSNVTITIKPDALFVLGTLIGKVFDDQNGNGRQDKGEEGLGNVKLATQEGIVVITDPNGRYHIPHLLPGRHLIKIDTTTLPAGSKLTTEKAVLIKSTDAMLNKANFGVKLPETYKKEKASKIPIKITVDQDYSPKVERDLSVQVLKNQGAVIASPDEVGTKQSQFQHVQDEGLLRRSDAPRNDKGIDKPATSVLHLSSNYPWFISRWKLDIIDASKSEPVKSLEGQGPPQENISINELNLSVGEYSLQFSAFDKDGQKDTTEYTFYVKGAGSLNEEIPQELKSKDIRYVDYSLQPKDENFNIPLKGNSLVIEGETAPANLLNINGNPVAVNKDGSFQERLIMPPGLYEIPISLKNKKGQIENLTRQVEVRENYFFFVALAEEELNILNIEGNIDSVSADDKQKLENNLSFDNRLAFYLKAKVKGKYLITSSLDTDRERSELFKNLEPEKYYAIYGDGSKIEYDATDTQDEFYLLIEADKSYLKWGSYGTGLTGTELLRYNRSVHGGKLHYESLKTSSYGEPKTLATVFTAQARQLASHDELRATGGSLYYLKHKDIISGSEKVYLETRDEISRVALNIQPMVEGSDYEIDYDQGRIIFHNPISSINRTNETIISGPLLDGHPVYVIADYEYENSSVMKDQSYGLRLARQITRHIRLGTTLVEENRQSEDYRLKGLDTQIHLPLNTQVIAEVAQSQRFQLRNFFSNDGGLTFTQVSAPDSAALGQAYKLALDSQPFKHTKLSFFYKTLDKEFSTTDTINETGMEKYGAKISQIVNPHLTFNLLHDRQELDDGGNELSDDLGADRLDTTTLQGVYAKNKFDWTSELRFENYQNRFNASKPDQTDYAATQVGFQWTKLTRLFLGLQGTLRGEDNNQVRAGINTKVSDNTNFYLVETVGNQGDATTLGIERIENETTSYYTNYTIENNASSSDNLKVTVGAKSQVTPNTHIYKEDQFNTFSGNPTSSNIYGLNTKINERLSADFSYEGTHTNNASTDTTYRAGKIALDFIDLNKLKLSQDFEIRFDDAANEQRQLLGLSQLEYQITPDLAYLSRVEYSLTKETNTDVNTARFDELQTGLAYRPIAFDWFNFLGQYKRTRDISPSSQEDVENVVQVNDEEYSAELALDILPRVTLVEKYSQRNKLQQISQQSLVPSSSHLVVHRLNFHLTHQWDFITEFRSLTNRQAKDTKDGYIIELDRLMGHNLRAGLGYHFAKYDNDLTPSSDYKTKGFFVRFTGTFFDLTDEEREERRLAAEKKKKEKEQKRLKLNR